MHAQRFIRQEWILIPGLVVALIAGGCSGGVGSHAEMRGVPVSDVLAQVEACQLPSNVNAPLAEQMKAALAEALRARGASEISQAPPMGSKNAVPDLAFSWSGASKPASLDWSFVSIGDYDQNGEVNVSDLTPLGAHFGASAPPPFDFASVLSVIDGDHNMEVNLADITPIAQNYLVRASAWNVYASQSFADYPAGPDAPNGPGAHLLGTVAQGSATGTPEERKRLTYKILGGDLYAGDFYWVRPTDGVADGAASNLVEGLSGDWLHTWGRSSQDYPGAILVDSENRLHVFGTTFESGDADVLLMRCGPLGDLQYSRTWGSATAYDWANGAALAGDRIAVTGATSSFGPGNRNVLLLYTDLEGILQWNGAARAFSAGAGTSCYGDAVTVDPGGDIWVAGRYVAATPGTAPCALIVRFGADGALKWQDAWHIGDDDALYAVCSYGPSGSIYVTGRVHNLSGYYDLLVACYNGYGTLAWVTTWDDTYSEWGTGITVDPNGNLYVVGVADADTANTTPKLLLMRLTPSGEPVWVRYWYTAEATGGNGIALDQTGHLHIAGYTTQGNWTQDDGVALLRYSVDGDLERRTYLPSSPDLGTAATAIAIDLSGRVCLAGYDHDALGATWMDVNCTSSDVTTGTTYHPLVVSDTINGSGYSTFIPLADRTYTEDIGGGDLDLLVARVTVR